MTCNCDNNGSNEYIIELGEQGIPGQQGEKGDPGFSPTVTYTGDSTGIQFNIINETETFTTPAVPLKSYVDTAFLKVDGSNANNPITLNGLTINKSGGSPIVTGDINLYLRGSQVSISANPSLSPTVGIAVQPNIISLGDVNTKYLVADTDTVKYGRLGQQSEIATLADIPSSITYLEVDGSNADSQFTVNGVKLTGNSVYINGVNYGGIYATQSNSNIYYTLAVDSSRAYLSMPSFTLNSYPAVSTGGSFSPALALLNSSGDIQISTANNRKLYYGVNQTANNEVAIKGDIPTVSDATITINQGGVTKGTFTLNGSATTIDLDAGGSAITNPLVIPSDSGDQSLTLGFEPNSSILTFKETLTLGSGGGAVTVDIPLPIIGSSPSSPVTLTKNDVTGISTIGLNYDNDTLKLDSNNKLYVDNVAPLKVLTDSEGLADITNMFDSSFDISKVTVFGSLTVSNNGIARGFSNANYLTVPTTYSDGVTDYREKITFTTSSDITTRQPVRGISANAQKGIGITVSNGRINYRIGTGTSWNQDNSIAISANTTYTVEFIQTSTTTTFNLYSEDGTLLGTKTLTYTSLLYEGIVLGKNLIWSGDYFSGSINLKQYSITINGVEVFNSNKTGTDTYTIDDNTVAIPYTLSKTGSKIVDSSYRASVASVYNDLGYSRYYTLEPGVSYTLPTTPDKGYLPNLNWLLKNINTYIIDTYSSNTSWYRIYSDGWCEQGGLISVNGVSGIYTVNFLKTFSSTDYSVFLTGSRTDASSQPIATVISGNKTASSMGVGCGSNTGDVYWKVEGYVSTT